MLAVWCSNISQAPIKIVSDVDDTLYGSHLVSGGGHRFDINEVFFVVSWSNGPNQGGGHFPAGCDHRFPGHQVGCSGRDFWASEVVGSGNTLLVHTHTHTV